MFYLEWWDPHRKETESMTPEEAEGKSGLVGYNLHL